MDIFIDRLYAAMNNQLNEVTVNGGTPIEQLQESIMICKKAMAKLKTYIANYAFEDQQEEIRFFKDAKPMFYSKYIYFINVYNFLMQKPAGGESVLKEYINSELADLKRFFDHNQSFYQYYRAGATDLDDKYFTRGIFNVMIELENFEEDEMYSTSHDYKLSKIIANEKFQEYLKLELTRIENEELYPAETPDQPQLFWTFNKTDLVELIYALVALGVFNNGQVAIRTVVVAFEHAFQIELGSYYHKYTDITNRKKERASFIDKLKLALLRKIDEGFEKDVPRQHRMEFRNDLFDKKNTYLMP
jgi:hypothetical protein